MHEDEFSRKLQLFHRWVCTGPNLFKTEIPPTPQEHQLFQFSLEFMRSFCVLCHFLSLWKLVGGCGPIYLLSGMMLKSLHFHQPQIIWPLYLPKSRMCTCIPSEWYMYSRPCNFEICHCVFSSRMWETSSMWISLYWPPMLWLGGEKSQMIPLSVGQ